MYIAITLLLGFSAVNTGNNLLFLVVSGLLAFMSVTGFAGMLNLKGLEPELLPPAEIFAGTAAPFRLRLHNGKRRLPSFLIRIECGGSQGGLLAVVPPASVMEQPVFLTFARRGPASIGTIRVSSSFPVNFFTRFWTYDAAAEFIVYPRLIPGGAAGDRSAGCRSGGSSRRERGLDGELERISPYSGREPLRAIHWKLSARGDDLLVKEMGSQSDPPLVIDPERLPGATLEERVSRAAWLVRHSAIAQPVGLRLGGTVIPPAFGRSHSAVLLRELACHGLD